MLCRTNVLHLRPQLDHFTYLTQFVWLCVVFYTIFFIPYYGISYTTFYVSLHNNCSPKIKCVISLLFIWLAFIPPYLFPVLMARFFTILVDSLSDFILSVDGNDISPPGDSVTIRNVDRKLTNLAFGKGFVIGSWEYIRLCLRNTHTRLCQGSPGNNIIVGRGLLCFRGYLRTKSLDRQSIFNLTPTPQI